MPLLASQLTTVHPSGQEGHYANVAEHGKKGRPREQRIEVVAIGTSTGGPAALHVILSRLPHNLAAGVLIVQHMPSGFTGLLAKRLNEVSPLEVKEAEGGEVIRPGLVLLAPAGQQMLVKMRQGQPRVLLTSESPFPTPFHPSFDALLFTLAPIYGSRCLAVILTGMGQDGVRGLKALKAAGGFVLAQDQATSVVYGMPRAAVEAGVVDRVLPLEEIPWAIVELVGLKEVP